MIHINNRNERIFNIGSGGETTINQLVELFKKYKPDLKVIYTKKREVAFPIFIFSL